MDLVLQEVASRLKKFVRFDDTVVRMGGVEFIVLLSALKETENVECVA